MACLDTTVLLDLAGGAKHGGRARGKVRHLVGRGVILATTRFNVAELLVGVARAADPEAERGKIEALLRPLVILEFDAPAAEGFGRIVGHLQARGTGIGDMDALIASIALSRGHFIVTRNARQFARVPGLGVETY